MLVDEHIMYTHVMYYAISKGHVLNQKHEVNIKGLKWDKHGKKTNVPR